MKQAPLPFCNPLVVSFCPDVGVTFWAAACTVIWSVEVLLDGTGSLPLRSVVTTVFSIVPAVPGVTTNVIARLSFFDHATEVAGNDTAVVAA